LHRFVELIPQLLARINLTHGSVGDDLNFLHAVREQQSARCPERNARRKAAR
jgi:hypothetical protein